MDESRRISIDVDDATLARIEALADIEQRSVADIAAEAIREHLATLQDYHAAIDEGLADFAAGRFWTHEQFLERRAESRRAWLANHTS